MLQLATALDARHWRPVIVYHPEPGLDRLTKDAASAGIEVCPIPSLRGVSGLGRLAGASRFLRRRKFALVHAHLNWSLACSGGLLAAAAAGMPVVATVQLWGESAPHPLLRLIARATVSHHIAVSEEISRRLRREHRLPADRVTVVHNGIQLTPPRQTFLESPLADGLSSPLVLTVARLESQKGLRHLVAAAEQVPNATFLIAGDGPERPVLERQIAGLGLEARVMLLGHRNDVPTLLACCDVFVLPSLHEGLPLAILEAMNAGVPVVATAAGGIPEAIRHEQTGLLVPAADPRALAAAIRRIVEEPRLSYRLSETGRREVSERFSIAATARGAEQVYAKALRFELGR
jgi:glycosyltransferase involved in cell wall biosynthesis